MQRGNLDFKVENFFLNGKTEKEAKEKQRERKNEKEMIRMLKGRRGEERRGEERRGETRLD